MSGELVTGTVKWVNDTKGFGFMKESKDPMFLCTIAQSTVTGEEPYTMVNR